MSETTTPPEANAASAKILEVGGPTFIRAFPNSLKPETCEDIIRRFEADGRKGPSTTATRDKPMIRTGTMLDISTFPEWQDVVAIYQAAVARNLHAYAQLFPSLGELLQPAISFRSPPLMERIEPMQGFGMHIDATVSKTHMRTVAVILYLRDIEAGGATEFPFQQVKVQPKAGTMLLFPPFWTHPHRGASPKSAVKYNLTSFIVIRDDWQPRVNYVAGAN
jgi:hypothetical protein